MNAPTSIDWLMLARRIAEAKRLMVHGDEPSLYGEEFEAEALRRGLGGERLERLSYDTLNPSTGLTTQAEAEHTRDSHAVVDRGRAERAERELAEVREELQRVYREARVDIARALRAWCNDRTVPARLRREGVLLAADRIDSGVEVAA
jgi:hypothetical protein